MTRDRYTYPEGLYDPGYHPELGETLFQSLDRITERFPEREALVDRDRRFTFSQYRACACRLAVHLHHLGVKTGDRVVSILPNWAEAGFGWYGVSAIGAVWAPLSLDFRERELRFVLGSVEPKVVIVVDSFGGVNHFEAVQRLLPEFPFIRHVLVKGQAPDGTRSLDQLMAEDPGIGDELAWTRRNFNPAADLGSALCLILHTSGTTGLPKGVMHSHNTVLSNSKAVARISATTEQDIFLHPLPIGQAVGLRFATDFPYAAGAKVVLLDTFEPESFLAAIERERATFLVGIPAMFRLALDHPDFDKYDVGTVRAGYLGAAASAPEDIIACHERLGEFVSIGGMSECGATTLTAFDEPMDIKSRSIGRVVPGGQAKIVDGFGRTLGPGEPGELLLKGPNVTLGYWNNPELNTDKFTSDGWFITGDAATMDEEGHVFLAGRSDDRIVRGGQKIYPVEVEGFLSTHPKLERCSLVGIPDPVLGERTVLCVKLRAGETLHAREIRDFCRGKIADYLAPDFVEIVDDIPVSPTGKILRERVRKMVRELRSFDRQSLSGHGQVRAKARTGFVEPRDALESELAAMWESILRIEPIGVNDDFFDLGGHSILAVQLCKLLEKAFGIRLPAAVVFEEPTIDLLANIVRQGIPSEPGPSLVAIRAQGSKPPLFALHGVGGTLRGIRSIFQYLGPEQPVYGLRSQGLYGDRVVHNSIEEMAAHYIAELHLVQSQGPYYLAGHSFGGALAFELARQLQVNGHEVAFLAMVDTYRGDLLGRRPIAERVGVHLRNLFRLDFRDKRAYLQPRLKRLADRFQQARIAPGVFGYRAAASSLEPGVVRCEELNSSAIRVANELAYLRYAPQPYEGRVTVFWAEGDQLADRYPIDPRLAWKGLARGGFDIQVCPGDHMTMLEEPLVRVLAERFKERLANAQASRAVFAGPGVSVLSAKH